MIYQSFKPSPFVQEFVDHYLLLHFDFKKLTASPTKLYYPHAEQCLTFNPKGSLTSINLQTGDKLYRSYSYFNQQQTSSYQLYFDEDYLMLKVVFQPGALFRLLGIPLSAFENQYIDAESVIPSEVRLVNEQLANAGNYTTMIQIVERYIADKIKTVKRDKHPLDKINELMNVQSANFSLDWVAGQACLSTRQLERKFLERIGVSPQTYYRIIRFNKAFKMKEQQPGLSWFIIAITCGYTDLQHLIKDFKQFARTTPTALLQEEANAIQHQFKLI
ncbi:helix-turn-helix domain-containing protein [Mucilaginibacter sp. OK098]|uniref:helix-turn-helix domain-containing protein n=1 Tax=Mucilaginibacter sp. OK098 TaxID=1855297 RepID=UPI000915784C|nr:helix-turn-helix domain-containing protein [Mucilaginibacter sp. OK098]SHN19735.1 Helix-turn-helix domain-containing protein [Mucilaginibacter sp. OK098]